MGCGGGKVLVNRDVNAAQNIAKVFLYWIEHLDRPPHLKRQAPATTGDASDGEAEDVAPAPAPVPAPVPAPTGPQVAVGWVPLGAHVH